MKDDVFNWPALEQMLEQHPWICYAEGDPVPPAPAAPPAPPAPPEAPAPITMTSEQLKERMDRGIAAHMKSLGIDPDQAKKDRDELATMRAAEDERKKAQMSEIDRLKAEKAESDVKVAAAERAAAASADQAAITRLCAESGVRDVAYATYRLADVPEGERAEKLAGWLKDPTEKARFNVGATAAPPKEPAQTTTSTQDGGAPTAPAAGGPPAGAPGGPTKSVDDMTTEEYRVYKQSKHGLS